MTSNTPAKAINRVAQARGILAGAITFPAVALGLYAALGNELTPAPYGALIAESPDMKLKLPTGRKLAESPDMLLRFGLAMVAAIATGFVSSTATKDYISGTSILAIGFGYLALAVLAGANTNAVGYVPGGGIASTEALTTNIIEIFFGQIIVLTAYFTAWQTDLHVVLPRRPGPKYVKKKVGVKELVGTNLTAFVCTGVLTLVLSYSVLEMSEKQAGVAFLWFACCAVSALAARRFFPVRSTFFLWTAPGLALATLSHEGLLGVFGSSLELMTRRYCRIPLGLLIPISVLATTMAYLMVPP
ncbi:MAG: hypothetical protein P1V97_04685, partial [Planctomycetota bacterium]|nr:hypothetical protein [Planctomycetota bacterium]